LDDLKAEGRAVRDGERAPREVDQVGHQVDETPTSKPVDARRTTRRLTPDEIARSLSDLSAELVERAAFAMATPRIAGFGLNKCEAALAECMPAALHAPSWRRLRALGVDFEAAPWGYFDRLFVEPVVVDNAGRFEFARGCADQRMARLAAVFAARDMDGEPIDLAALDLDSGALATWRGRAALLGEDNLLQPRLGEPLRVHRSATEWLAAGRDGIFIINWSIAADQLGALRQALTVDDIAFGQLLRERLTRPAPAIFVEQRSEVAA